MGQIKYIQLKHETYNAWQIWRITSKPGHFAKNIGSPGIDGFHCEILKTVLAITERSHLSGNQPNRKEGDANYYSENCPDEATSKGRQESHQSKQPQTNTLALDHLQTSKLCH